jgi:predicted RecB family nuclease
VEKHILSKSTFLRGLQCPKSLYLYKNFIQLRDTPSTEQQAIFNRGNHVGLFAQKLFPGGKDASPVKRSDNLSAVAKTKELIEEGCEIIYEAAFQHEQVLAILDILVKKDGRWYAYEVKSSTKISQTYLLDASLQYWVINGSGTQLEDISLITINNQYIRKGDLDPHALFNIRSVKKEALSNQDMITEKIMQSKLVAASAQMPEVRIGEQCFSPYNCDFMGTCWKSVPKNSVFEITGISKADQFALYDAGIKTINEIPSENLLDKNANLHISSSKSGETVVDKAAVKHFLAKISYPVYFMDFETFMPALPVYEATKPYQHIPFQYSLHYKSEQAAPVLHYEFLAEQGLDPRRAFIERLLEHTSGNGSILVFDALMEKNVLNGLKKDFPEFSQQIEERLSRFVDLMIPFQSKAFYHPAMKNSFSIKNLLPALAPELSYTDLKISSGSIAMIAFEKLQTETDMFRILEVREQLLEYCKMDTLAMVRIFEILERSVD